MSTYKLYAYNLAILQFANLFNRNVTFIHFPSHHFHYLTPGLRQNYEKRRKKQK